MNPVLQPLPMIDTSINQQLMRQQTDPQMMSINQMTQLPNYIQNIHPVPVQHHQMMQPTLYAPQEVAAPQLHPVVTQTIIKMPQSNQNIIQSMPPCDAQSIPVSYTQALEPQTHLIQPPPQLQQQMPQISQQMPQQMPQMVMVQSYQPVLQSQPLFTPQEPQIVQMMAPPLQEPIVHHSDHIPPQLIDTHSIVQQQQSQVNEMQKLLEEQESISIKIDNLYEKESPEPIEQPIVQDDSFAKHLTDQISPQHLITEHSFEFETDHSSFSDTISVHSLAADNNIVEVPTSALRVEVKPMPVKQHKCPECSRQFHRKSDFTRHLKIHTGIKPFKCAICDKGFLQKSALTVHMRTHTGERPYACSYCGRKFADMSALRKHEQGRHEKRRYFCPVHQCLKSFSRKNALNGHMKTHKCNFPLH